MRRRRVCAQVLPEPMKQLLIVYNSQSGASAGLAMAAMAGANANGLVAVRVLRAADAGVADLAGANGVLLVAAENSGTLAGGMKDFLDRTLYPVGARALVLPYALLVSAGNDGRGAVAQAQRILSGFPFTEAAEPLILRGDACQGHLSRATELGEALAAGLDMGIF